MINKLFNAFTKMGLGLALVGTASFGMVQTADAQNVLKIGTEGAFPPFNFVDKDGNVGGFDVDIAKALCAEMKRECEFVVQDWDGMIPALQSKKFDALVASMSITEDRMRVIDFTRPYYADQSRFVAKMGAFADDKPATLGGKRIGVQRATINQDYLEKYYSDVTIMPYGSQEEANLDLVAGRVDAVMAEQITLDEGFLKTDAGKGYGFFGGYHFDKSTHGEGIGIGVRKQDSALKAALNDAIMAIKANGTYDQINDKYFDYSIWVD
ncbi:MAG: lysine/arginine/ornithine ABC transporter substrate-binding protein [Alphaproteobacteria bacterium]